MTMKKSLVLAVAAVAALAGCATESSGTNQGRVTPTYQEAAQDAMVLSSREAVSKLTEGLAPSGDGPVLVATLVNVNDMTRSAPLGRTLSEQYASAMASQGYNVKEIKLRGTVFVREGTGELLLSREVRDIARSQNASLVLVGTFSPASTVTYVSTKLVRTEDSRIVRGYDYALPNNRDVKALLQPPVLN